LDTPSYLQYLHSPVRLHAAEPLVTHRNFNFTFTFILKSNNICFLSCKFLCVHSDKQRDSLPKDSTTRPLLSQENTHTKKTVPQWNSVIRGSSGFSFHISV